MVIKDYPDAIAKNIGCKNGDYFHIYSGLGQGKSKKAAWRAANNNLNN